MGNIPKGLFCVPQPGSTYHINVGKRDKSIKVYLCAQSNEISPAVPAILQCWTNLPVHGSEQQNRDRWHAIDIGRWPPSDVKEYFLTKPIELSTETLENAARKGDNVQYALTWRLLTEEGSDDAQSQIQWLFPSNYNAVLIFHLHQQRAIEHLIADLHLANSLQVVVEEGDTVILTGGLELSNDESSTSVRLLDSSRQIHAGAVWERTKTTWHTARSIVDFNEISDGIAASLIALQYQDIDKVVVILPVCTENASITLLRDKESLQANIHQFVRPKGPENRIVIAIGPTKDLHRLIRKCFAQIQNSVVLDLAIDEEQHPLLGNSGLGFCSWEALGTGKERPSLPTLGNVLQKFDKRSLGSISTLLIDDGWQHVSSGRKLLGFDLDPTLYGDESEMIGESHLGHHVALLKKKFPRIERVGVWMTLAGYWEGLDTESFDREYGPLIKAQFYNPNWSDQRRWHLPATDKLAAFYNDYFSLLRKAGISFVKVDDQSDWEWIHSLASTDGRKVDTAPSTYFDQAWMTMTSMAEKHFGPQSVIHCMAFGHRFLTRLATSPISIHHHLHFRNSDDTFPKVPKSHTWHIYHNALNACLSSANSRVIADADMITSYMPPDSAIIDWADFHTAFRACFSQSKIWISDSVEVSEMGRNKILGGLLAYSKDPNTKSSLGILKTVQIGMEGDQRLKNSLPLPSRTFTDLTGDQLGPALKMSVSWKTTSSSPKASPQINCLFSVWNVRYSSDSLDWIYSSDVAQALDDQDTSNISHLFLFCAQSLSVVLLPWTFPTQIDSDLLGKPIVPIQLAHSKWKVFSIATAFPYNNSSSFIACVGLIDKYAGLTTVVESCQSKEDGVIISSLISRAGNCGFILGGNLPMTLNHIHAQVDAVGVHKTNLQVQRISNCFLVIVDMQKHLESVENFNHSTRSWQVDLIMEDIG